MTTTTILAKAADKRLPIEIGHTAYAAALSTFGCPISWTRVRSLSSDQHRTVWHVVPVPAACHADIDPEAVLAAYRTRTLDPHHLFADAVRGVEARRALTAWQNKAVRQRLVAVTSARWEYERGEGPPDDGTGWVRVQGAPMAAALGVLGCAVVRPEDGGLFLVRKRGLPAADGSRADAADLCQRFTDGRMRAENPNHPFLCAWQGAVNYEAMLECIHKGGELLLVNAPDPRSTKHAYMPADAPGWRWDRCRKFLLGRG